MTELVYPDCLVIVGEDPNDPRVHESYIKCKECQAKLEHKHKPEIFRNNEWVKSFFNREGVGYHINQLYSSTVTPGEFAQSALRARTNPADEQELYNSKCGVTHSIAGFNVQDADLDACKTKFSYSIKDILPSGRLRTMGIDVGAFLHWVVREWEIPRTFHNPNDPGPECTPRVIAFGKCRHMHELDALLTNYAIHHAVIDANPSRREAYNFAVKHWGRVHTCYYVRGANGKQLQAKQTNDNEAMTDEPAVCVDRTSWLDATLSRYKRCGIGLPQEIDEEYRAHLKALKRIFEKGPDNELISRYEVADEVNDHYAHAENYAEIALPFALKLAKPVQRKKRIL